MGPRDGLVVLEKIKIFWLYGNSNPAPSSPWPSQYTDYVRHVPLSNLASIFFLLFLPKFAKSRLGEDHRTNWLTASVLTTGKERTKLYVQDRENFCLYSPHWLLDARDISITMLSASWFCEQKCIKDGPCEVGGNAITLWSVPWNGMTFEMSALCHWLPFAIWGSHRSFVEHSDILEHEALSPGPPPRSFDGTWCVHLQCWRTTFFGQIPYNDIILSNFPLQ